MAFGYKSGRSKPKFSGYGSGQKDNGHKNKRSVNNKKPDRSSRKSDSFGSGQKMSLGERMGGAKEGVNETAEGVGQLAKGGLQLGMGVSRLSHGDVVGGLKDVYKGYNNLKDGSKNTRKGIRDTVDSAKGDRKAGEMNNDEKEEDLDTDSSDDEINEDEEGLKGDGKGDEGSNALKNTAKFGVAVQGAKAVGMYAMMQVGFMAAKAALDAVVGFFAGMVEAIKVTAAAAWNVVVGFASSVASSVGGFISSAGAWLGGALGIGSGVATTAVGFAVVGSLVSVPLVGGVLFIQNITNNNSNPSKWEHRVNKCDDEQSGRKGLAAGGYPAFPLDKEKYGSATTSSYGWRVHPITGVADFHDGLDIAGPNMLGEADVYATRAGEVLFAGNTGHGGGYAVLIRHEVEDRLSQYYHLHAGSLTVKTGDMVNKGQAIAKVGTTGMSTGPHLHFMIIEAEHYPYAHPYNKGMHPADYLKESVDPAAADFNPKSGGGSKKKSSSSSKSKKSFNSNSSAGGGAVFNVNDITSLSNVPDAMDNAQKLYSVMRKMGFPEDVMAVFMTHVAYESSGFDSTAVETIYNEPFRIGPRKQAAERAKFHAPTFVPAYHADNNGVIYMGLGLSQWSNGRNKQLLDYADLVGAPWHEFGTQIAFMFDEEKGDGWDFKNLVRVAEEEGNTGNYSRIARRLWNEYFRGDAKYKEDRIALSASDGRKLKSMFKTFKYDEKYAASVLKGIKTGKLNISGRYDNEDECGPSVEDIQAADGLSIDGLFIEAEGEFRKLIETLKNAIGAKYEAGALTPPDDDDNPGKFGVGQLVSWAFKETFNDEVPVSSSELYRQSERIRSGSEKPGDLVFFHLTDENDASSVGIYMGDGQMVMTTVDGVKVLSVEEVKQNRQMRGYSYGRIKNFK